MTRRLTIQVLGVDLNGKERVYSRLESATLDLTRVDVLVGTALDEARACIGVAHDSDLRPLQPQVAIWISGGGVRPALNLSAPLVARIAQAGASLDFDPYP